MTSKGCVCFRKLFFFFQFFFWLLSIYWLVSLFKNTELKWQQASHVNVILIWSVRTWAEQLQKFNPFDTIFLFSSSLYYFLSCIVIHFLPLSLSSISVPFPFSLFHFQFSIFHRWNFNMPYLSSPHVMFFHLLCSWQGMKQLNFHRHQMNCFHIQFNFLSFPLSIPLSLSLSLSIFHFILSKV